MSTLTNILAESIKRNPLRSQREACAVAARRSIAALGPVHSEGEIRDACVGLASGLFSNAYTDATIKEQDRLIALMEEEYHKAIRDSSSSLATKEKS